MEGVGGVASTGHNYYFGSCGDCGWVGVNRRDRERAARDLSGHGCRAVYRVVVPSEIGRSEVSDADASEWAERWSTAEGAGVSGVRFEGSYPHEVPGYVVLVYRCSASAGS